MSPARSAFGQGLWARAPLTHCLLVSILLALGCGGGFAGVNAIRAKRSSVLELEDDSIHTEYVDRNNRTILAMFNLTEAQMSRIYAGTSGNNKNPSAQPRDSQYFNNIKEYRIKDIQNRLQSAFQVSNSEESQEHPLHEMAAYPICESDSNESSWLHDNNVTIKFSDSLFEPKRDNLNLDSAILRLYKVNPNGTADDPNNASGNTAAASSNQKLKRCADDLLLDAQIRVTVSIVQQLRRNRRERKKRICNTIMMNVSKTGWVEIDIKRAIYIWENIERQQQLQQLQQQQQTRQHILVGWLMIEVHDEEERPLKPGLYFKPPKCDQADLAIPWNYYRPHTPLSASAAHEVPRYPRLDVKLIGYASFAPKSYNKHLHHKLRANLRRQLYNLSENSAEMENDSTTVITPTAADNLLESSASTEIVHNHRKRHLRHHHYHQQHQQHQQPNSQEQQQHEQELYSQEEYAADMPQKNYKGANSSQSPVTASSDFATSEQADEDEWQHNTRRHRRRQRRHHQHQQHKHHHIRQQQQQHQEQEYVAGGNR